MKKKTLCTIFYHYCGPLILNVMLGQCQARNCFRRIVLDKMVVASLANNAAEGLEVT